MKFLRSKESLSSKKGQSLFNRLLASLDSDFPSNMLKVVDFLGEMFDDSIVFYCRMDKGELAPFVQSNLPGTSVGEGLICKSLVAKSSQGIVLIDDFARSDFAHDEADLLELGIRSCVGRPIDISGINVAAFAILFYDKVKLSREQLELIEGVAALIRREEKRHYLKSINDLIYQAAIEAVEADADSYNRNINDLLTQLGERLDVDRSYLFTYDENDDTITNTHEWVRNGVTEEIVNLQKIDWTVEVPWIRSQVLEGLKIVVPDTDLMNGSYLALVDKSHLQRQQIKSLVVVPILAQGKLKGFIGLDYTRFKRTWDEEIVSAISTIGTMITTRIED